MSVDCMKDDIVHCKELVIHGIVIWKVIICLEHGGKWSYLPNCPR